jgi:putative peptidoglycan lipid II flippase
VSRSLHHISIVSLATVLSRFLGLARDILVTAVFGASGLASAFVTAFTLPNLFRRLLGEGALTAALVPTLNEALVDGPRRAAFDIVNQVASWLGLVTLLIVGGAMLTLNGMAGAVWLESAARDAAQWERWQTAAQLAVVLFPYLVFVCLAAAFGAALQTLGRFAVPALTPVWLNVAMIGALGWAVWGIELSMDDARMRWLCGGVLVGGFGQMVLPAIDLIRTGWRPRVDFRLTGAVRSILLLMGPTVLGSAIYLINTSVSRLIGLSLSDSAAAILNLASRLIELPIGVFAVAVTTVVFPMISRDAAQGDWARMAASYRKGMRLILAINIPAAIGMALLAAPIIRVLFERGQFLERDTAEMIPVLGVFAIGLPFLAFVSLLLRAFYAQKDTRTPLKAACASFVVNIALCFALKGPLGTVGLALAGTVSVIVQAVWLQWQLTRRRPELAIAPLRTDFAKIVLSSAAMGLGLLAGRAALDAMGSSWWADVARLLILIPIGGAIFAGGVYLLKLDGLSEAFSMLRDRYRRSAQTKDPL